MTTQETIDKAYAEGKAEWIRVIGTHGPTLKQIPLQHAINPYPRDSKERLAWQRGYNQDTRRVVA